jgi:hypothetical protein
MAVITKGTWSVGFNEDYIKTFKSADEWLKTEPQSNKDFWKNDIGITDAELKDVYAKSVGKAVEATAEPK